MGDVTLGVLSGRCNGGEQRGHGYRIHVVDRLGITGRAKCGAKPGKRSAMGFVEPDDRSEPCPKCLPKEEPPR